MGYEYKPDSRTKQATHLRARMILKLSGLSFAPAITSAYFSFIGFVTKPLYMYYARTLHKDEAILSLAGANFSGKRRTSVFLRRR